MKFGVFAVDYEEMCYISLFEQKGQCCRLRRDCTTMSSKTKLSPVDLIQLSRDACDLDE